MADILEGITKDRNNGIYKSLKDKQNKILCSPPPMSVNNEGKINLFLDKLKLRDIYQAESHCKK